MTNENKKPQIIAAIATVLLVGSIIYLAMEMNANNTLEEKLNSEKLKSETMLSEKLALEKEIVKFRSEIKSLTGKNQELDIILAATSSKLDAKDQELKKVRNENASLVKIKKQHQDLLKLKEELEQQLASYNTSLKQLKIANEDLTQTVALLQQKNKSLTDELNQSRLVSINDVRIESLKKNNKLTVNAKRTKKLMINLDVPAAANDLMFKITSPAGKELTTKDGTIASRIVSTHSTPSYVASLNGHATSEVMYKEVEMTYTPNGKMTAGVYKVDIISNNVSIGSLQVRFR